MPQAAHEDPLTPNEAKLFLLKEPLLGCDNFGPEEERKIFELCRKKTRAYFATIRKKKRVQVGEDLKRKEEQVAAAERREAKALERFKSKENYTVYHSAQELRAELARKHSSGKCMYTTAMKVDIVLAQLQFRRDCLLRTLRPGTLCSSVKDPTRRLVSLVESFARVVEDEQLYPTLLSPPEIRRVYQTHPFANDARKELDANRNAVTREMTRHFLEVYDGGIFVGWRCTVDYAKGHPLNPGALVGQKVTKTFDGVSHSGTITRFNKWWLVQYDDGDFEEYNYRQLEAMEHPPDFTVLKYPTPDVMAQEFLKASNGTNSMQEQSLKGGAPEEFTLDGATWTLISVYNVLDSKSPLQGAYVEEDEFCHGMRVLGLQELISKHPSVKISPMDKIRAWIEASSDLTHQLLPL